LNRAGEDALAAGNSSAAAKSFASALEALGGDTLSPEYTTAKLGLAEASIFGDPRGARDAFLALAREKPERIQDRDFNAFATKLGEANHIAEATEVLSAGIALFPESPYLVALRDALGKKAEASGDQGALDALSGLGYVGDK
jgi:hypothetical protein